MENKKGTVKKVLGIIGNTLIWIFVVFAVVVTVLAFAAQTSAERIPSLGGKVILTVQSPSMEPTIMQGDIIIGRMLTSEEQLSRKVGDIVTFVSDIGGQTVTKTHRIVGILPGDGAFDGQTRYVTQGDNKETNPTADPPVVAGNVISIYEGTRIPFIGNILSFLQQPTGFLVAIVLPLALFFLYELILFVRKLLQLKNEGKKQISAADEELIRQRAVEEYIKSQQAQQAAQPEEPKPEEPKPDSADTSVPETPAEVQAETPAEEKKTEPSEG